MLSVEMDSICRCNGGVGAGAVVIGNAIAKQAHSHLPKLQDTTHHSCSEVESFASVVVFIGPVEDLINNIHFYANNLWCIYVHKLLVRAAIQHHTMNKEQFSHIVEVPACVRGVGSYCHQ